MSPFGLKKRPAMQAAAPASSALVAGEDMEFVEECSFEPIEKLQSAGINASEIARFKEHGFHTIGAILQSTFKELMTVKGVTVKRAELLSDTLCQVFYIVYYFVIGSKSPKSVGSCRKNSRWDLLHDHDRDSSDGEAATSP